MRIKINKIILTILIAPTLLIGCGQAEEQIVLQQPDLLNAGPVVVNEDNSVSEHSDDEEGEKVSDDEISTIRVFVCGEVRNPGVYELESSSRVCDAIIRAGDFTGDADINYLNQAAYLTDGQRLYVPSEEEVAMGSVDETSNVEASSGNGDGVEKESNTGSDDLVNINQASVSELKTLPGIGDVKAAAIVSYREANGDFSSTEQIMKVDGIKSGLYDSIKDKISVGK